LVHEPGITALGRKLTTLLKWAQNIDINPLAELFLFNASRNQLVEEVIRPSLDKGTIIICDRYADSSLAYQGYGRGLEITTVRAINDMATQGLVPDLTILLDMPISEGQSRKRGEKQDRFEGESNKFHEQVREGFLKLAKADPERWLVIDAKQNKEVIAGTIWQKISRLLT
jgi:dTMP kinase